MKKEQSDLRRIRSRENSPPNKWTPEQDEALKEYMSKKDVPDFAALLINPLFKNKTKKQISERWSKVLNPVITKGRWNREDDNKLIQHVKKYGEVKWYLIAAQLKRSGKQCRERYVYHLRPNLKNKKPFTPEETEQLMNLVNKCGKYWDELAKYFPGRSGLYLKNRWNYLRKKGFRHHDFVLPIDSENSVHHDDPNDDEYDFDQFFFIRSSQ